MSLTVPFEIALQVIQDVQEAFDKDLEGCSKDQDVIHRCNWARRLSLLRMRATSRSFRAAADSILFPDIVIDRISPVTLKRLNSMLQSSSICAAVRTYSFTPKVYTFQPTLTDILWAYSREPPEYYTGSRSLYLKAKCEACIEDSEYKEQMDILGLTKWNIVSQSALPRSHRASLSRLSPLSYFSELHKFTRLTRIEFGYHIPASEEDTPLHYRVKTDISAAISCFLLSTHFPCLTVLHLRNLTLTDLKQIVEFVTKQSTFIKLGLESIKLMIVRETLLYHTQELHGLTHNSRKFNLDTHSTSGKALSDFLQLCPNAKDLDISYPQTPILYPSIDARFHEILILQTFHPPLLPNLKRLSLKGIAITAEALIVLILSSSSLAKWRVTRFLLLKSSMAWADVFRRLTIQYELHPETQPEFYLPSPYLYLDTQLFDEAVRKNLKPWEARPIQDPTDADKQALQDLSPE